MHQAIAERAFRAAGPGAVAARAIHQGVTRGVYAGLGLGTRALGMAAGAALARREAPELSTTPRGSAVIAAITGLRGDALEAEGSPLHQPMAVRVGGEPVPPDADALAAAFPEATGRMVVFLHGLMETEFSGASRRRAHTATRLASELGWTPVYVRYNSGRRISRNGQSLSELMEELVAAWPVEVERIALVGHSMGGLVARSACHHAAEDGAEWVGHMRHSVSLGVAPHGRAARAGRARAERRAGGRCRRRASFA